MAKIIIDGIETEGREGESLLDVARRVGIDIPALCHHPAVEPYGACRLCVVEVIDRGRSRITTACTYPAIWDVEVKTQSEKVRETRRLMIELLLGRAPKAKRLLELAEEYGARADRFKADDPENLCILCGLCVRVCEEVVGASAIGFQERGMNRDVGTPLNIQSEMCIGCGACAAVCPTDAIKIEDEGDTRTIAIWNTQVKLTKCPSCGRFFAPEVQLERLREKVNVECAVCPECAARGSAAKLALLKTSP